MAIPLWVREKLFQKSLLHDELKRLGGEFDWENRLLFLPSIIKATPLAAPGRGHHLEILKEIHFPTGFKVNSGLAAYHLFQASTAPCQRSWGSHARLV